MNAPASLRKKLLVNSFIQGKTIRRVIFYWCTYHLVLWHVMFLYRYVQYRGELLAGAAPRTFGDLYSQFSLDHYSLVVCALAILPLVAWDALTFSHKVVGPLARFRHCLKLLTLGEPVTQVKIRQGDFLVELQDAFNQFLDSPYNTVRFGNAAVASIPTVAPAAPNESAWPVEDESRLLEDLREIQASLWRQYTPEGEPQPVSVTPAPPPQHVDA